MFSASFTMSCFSLETVCRRHSKSVMKRSSSKKDVCSGQIPGGTASQEPPTTRTDRAAPTRVVLQRVPHPSMPRWAAAGSVSGGQSGAGTPFLVVCPDGEGQTSTSKSIPGGNPCPQAHSGSPGLHLLASGPARLSKPGAGKGPAGYRWRLVSPTAHLYSDPQLVCFNHFCRLAEASRKCFRKVFSAAFLATFSTE